MIKNLEINEKGKEIHQIFTYLILPLMALMFIVFFVEAPSSSFAATAVNASKVNVSVTSPIICKNLCLVTSSDSQIHIVASASSSHPITGWHIYTDSANVYGANNVASIDMHLNVSKGAHTVLVRAWDSTGAYETTELKVTITPVSPVSVPVPPTTPISKSPINSVLLSNIEDVSGWKTCGNCGNTNASGATATYSMVQNIAKPSLSGSSAQFNIAGKSAYSNAYWYINHSAPAKLIKNLTYDFWLYIPTTSAKAPQAIEFEAEQHVNGLIYNYAWQADYGSKTWRIFNYTSKRWEPSGVAFTSFTPDTWHHIVAEYHATGNVGYHDALTVDGIRHPVSISHTATNKNVNTQFTNAFQLDLNGQKNPYSVYVDKMNMSYSL